MGDVEEKADIIHLRGTLLEDVPVGGWQYHRFLGLNHRLVVQVLVVPIEPLIKENIIIIVLILLLIIMVLIELLFDDNSSSSDSEDISISISISMMSVVTLRGRAK